MEEEYNFSELEHNVKLYKMYKMFAYDWVFFYAISVLFFNITKGFSTSEVVYLTAFYTLSYCIFQIPGNYIVKKLGLRKSIILGNILSTITILMYIFFKSFDSFVVAQFINGFSFALKGLSESDMLCSSMKKLGKFDKFSKVEGASNAKYYFFDAVASIISGFSFTINEYLPISLCLIVTIIALVASFKFNDVKLEVDSEEKTSLIKSINNFIRTLSSRRLKSIYLVAFVFTGITQVAITLYKSVLIDIGLTAEYITMLVFFYVAFAGIGSKLEFFLEKITKNKNLTFITITYITSLGIIGLLGLINILNLFTLSSMIFILSLMGFLQGAYKVALKKYTVSFTTSKIRTRITSIGLMFEYAGTTIISFASAYLLEHTSNSFACVIVCVIGLLVMIGIIKYMDGRLGLKPEEYKAKDINNIKL